MDHVDRLILIIILVIFLLGGFSGRFGGYGYGFGHGGMGVIGLILIVLLVDQLFVGHHPMVGRWKQAIDTFQPEWLPESDGLGARHSCRRAPRLMAAIPGG